MLVLKIIGFVVLFIIALIVVVLSIPVFVTLSYSDELRLVARVLGARVDILPKENFDNPSGFWQKNIMKLAKWLKDNKAKKKAGTAAKSGQKSEKKKSDTKSSLAQLTELRGIDGTLKLLWLVAKLATGASYKSLRSVGIDRFDFNMRIGGEDAADAAITYGKICSVIFPALSLLFQRVHRARQNVVIVPDFERDDISLTLDAKFHIFPIVILAHLAAAGAKMLFHVIKDTIIDKINEIRNSSQGGA